MIRVGRLFVTFVVSVFVAIAACTAPSLDGKIFSCKTNGDCTGGKVCVDRAPLGLVCETAGGGGDGGPSQACASNQECITKFNGEAATCVKATGLCQRLLNADCTEVIVGKSSDTAAQRSEIVGNENTIWFGFISDLQGSNKLRGVATRNAVALQVNEFHAQTRGIPGGPMGSNRPIGFVICSETPDATTAVDVKRAGKHLIEDLHVPGILGPSGTDPSIELLNSYALKDDVVLFAPSTASAGLTSFQDKDLFWRTSPSGVVQARALQRQIVELEAKVRAANTTLTQVKLAVVYGDDAFGIDISNAAKTGLSINGASVTAASNVPNFLLKSYNSSATATAADYATTAGALSTFGAHIILVVGRGESPKLLTALEAMPATIRPEYLFTTAGQTSSLLAALQANTNNIRSRTRGVVPFTPALGASFKALYDGTFPQPANPPTTFGVPGAYDIAYLFSYAALAALKADPKPLTGPRLVDGLKRVLKGADQVNVGIADINTAFSKIQAGTDISVKGVSYEFPFDLAIGEAPHRFDVWCVGSTGGMAAYKVTGQVFDPRATAPGDLTGSYTCPPDN
jgi:ABC-type branched-subunit amino acid transport system substrate-binding protein